ncbi:hypothetical protein ABT160_38010 [Streptomyces sp. NPDC001941]|uniref:hypothetical protein n=1 Tax=Streptomyces sp. NPDC001941 TaxID=3154659 RepID=UPI003317C8FC
MQSGLNRALRVAGVVLAAGAVWSADGGPQAAHATAAPAVPTDAPVRDAAPRVSGVTADAAVAGPGDTVGWVVELSGPAGRPGAPARLDVDLSGVLASADLAGAPVVSGPGRAVVRGRALHWNGSLAPGERTRVHFSTTVHREVGRHELTLPRAAAPVRLRGLELTVRASPHEVTGEAPTVFEVSARNVGGGAWTGSDPATFDIDLADLLAAGARPVRVRATSGTTAFMGRHLVWTGPLAAGHSATVTFAADLAPRPGAQPRRLTVWAASELASGPCTPSGADRACRAEVRVAAPAADGAPPDRTALYLSVGAGSVLAGLAGAGALAARRRRRDADGTPPEPITTPVHDLPTPPERTPAMSDDNETFHGDDRDAEVALDTALESLESAFSFENLDDFEDFKETAPLDPELHGSDLLGSDLLSSELLDSELLGADLLDCELLGSEGDLVDIDSRFAGLSAELYELRTDLSRATRDSR